MFVKLHINIAKRHGLQNDEFQQKASSTKTEVWSKLTQTELKWAQSDACVGLQLHHK